MAALTPGHLQSRHAGRGAAAAGRRGVCRDRDRRGAHRGRVEPASAPANSEVVAPAHRPGGDCQRPPALGATSFEVRLVLRTSRTASRLEVTDDGAASTSTRGAAASASTARQPRAAEVGGGSTWQTPSPARARRLTREVPPMTVIRGCWWSTTTPWCAMGLVAMLASSRTSRSSARRPTAARRWRWPRELGPTWCSWTCGCRVMDGAEATARMRRARTPAAVLVLTTYDTDADIVRAVEAGANGYLLKDAPRETLADADAGARPEARRCSRLRWSPGWPAGCGRARAADADRREVEVLAVRRQGSVQRRGRPRAVHRRGDGEDPPAAGLREARGDRPHGGRHGGIPGWA